jgi:putative inorganic carbon (HCO3(-)) transporter
MEILPHEINRYIKITFVFAISLLSIFTFLPGIVLSLISILALFALAYIVAQFNLASIFILMVLLIPLSTNQRFLDSEVSLLMPSEPIEALITLAFGIKILFGYRLSNSVIKHPIFWFILLGILIQCIATLNSTMPLVSLKSLLLKACYVIVFFMLSADLYIKQSISHFKVLKTYLYSLFIVGVIIFLKHIENGLSKDSSGTVTEPFYADHTIYSACLAMILPLPLLSFYNAKTLQINYHKKFWLGCLTFVMLVFFFFTYCRAGWISFVIAFVVTYALFLGLRFRGLFITIISVLALMFVFQTDIEYSLKQNKADSNAKNASIEQQTKSVTNITSDQSNAERLNRWSCAWRMFLDRPLLGYGPGTYQFEYLIYQKKNEMTRISVTSAYNIKKGKGGTAHSEYLLLLAESGIVSFLIYIIGVLMVIYYAIKVFANAQNSYNRIKITVIFFGFCTYILHAFFNNFLDTDKAALLYYTSIAAIMVEAIQQKKDNRIKST